MDVCILQEYLISGELDGICLDSVDEDHSLDSEILMARCVPDLAALKHIEIYLISENAQFLSNNILNTCTEYGNQLRKFVGNFVLHFCATILIAARD